MGPRSPREIVAQRLGLDGDDARRRRSLAAQHLAHAADGAARAHAGDERVDRQPLHGRARISRAVVAACTRGLAVVVELLRA